jgi:predicted DNA-binding helix-hairpin-helix protein
MEAAEKLSLFAEQMHLEPAEENGRLQQASIPLNVLLQNKTKVAPCGQVVETGGGGLPVKKDSLGIHPAVAPGGQKMSLLKTMITSACERNCFYCPFRAGRNYRRATFKPEELAKTFLDMNRAGMVNGMFLSSGIIRGGVTTQDKIIDTADILRNKLGFRGYLHLKIMPGADKDQVYRTMQLASRVSVNLEGANDKRLHLLAPQKVFMEELLEPLKWVEEIRQTQRPTNTWNGRWPSSVTQFVVGAVGESDLELLTTSDYLLNTLKLTRTYYSAFSPVSNTPLEENPAEDPLRQHRLYQASFLMRDYGFDLEEMPFTQDGNLPLTADPKQAWARAYLSEAPVELNKADRETLLRVPGIGPKSAATILNARRRGKIKELNHLKALGLNTTRPAPYVLLDGKRPNFQLPLFDK